MHQRLRAGFCHPTAKFARLLDALLQREGLMCLVTLSVLLRCLVCAKRAGYAFSVAAYATWRNDGFPSSAGTAFPFPISNYR